MRYKRGQAALEFLTTYGWAFLVILVVIGALAYFGVLNPQRFVPDRCTFQQEFMCRDYQVAIEGNDVVLRMFLQNNLGNTVTIPAAGLNATSIDANIPDIDCTGASQVQIGAGDSAEFTCTFTNGATSFPAAGAKTKFDIDMSYTEVGGRYPHSVQGEVLSTIQ